MNTRVTFIASAITTLILSAPGSARADDPIVVSIPAPPIVPLPVPPAGPYPPPYPYGVAPYPPPPLVVSPAEMPPPEPERPRHFSFKAFAGPAYRRVYDIPISAADVGLSFGSQRGIYGEIGALLGRTDQGLFTWQIRPQATFEWPLGRVRLGFGAGFTMIGIQRATRDSYLVGFGVGATGFASVDLVRSARGNALFLAGKMALDVLPGGSTDSTAVLWGPSALLGFRY
ncbi:Hypothetical protein A7982_02668 [Minicystis rosea]|nr:Hypothetical protein A7982_02668 [Minicystis rosea]